MGSAMVELAANSGFIFALRAKDSKQPPEAIRVRRLLKLLARRYGLIVEWPEAICGPQGADRPKTGPTSNRQRRKTGGGMAWRLSGNPERRDSG